MHILLKASNLNTHSTGYNVANTSDVKNKIIKQRFGQCRQYKSAQYEYVHKTLDPSDGRDIQ